MLFESSFLRLYGVCFGNIILTAFLCRYFKGFMRERERERERERMNE